MLDDKFIIRRIQNYVERGINSEDGDVTTVRQDMFARYMGELEGNEREGYSKFVTREVLEAVEWALPSMLRVLMGGQRVVQFRARGPQDVEQAKHETEVVNHWFYDGNPDSSGFLTLYSWTKDLLMFPNAYVKVGIEEEEITDEQGFEGVVHEWVEQQREIEGQTVQIEREYTDPQANVPVCDVTIIKQVWEKRIVLATLAPDSVIIDHAHASLDVESARFICIREQKTRSELIEEGYDPAELEDLGPDYDNLTWTSESIVRHFYTDEQPEDDSDEFDLPADEVFWRHECYMFIDADEDGISERRRIVMVGCKILENEEHPFNPVIAASALPMPHKHIGMGYAELVADIQTLMTTLTRQLLDNIYKQNVQRRFISEQALLSDNSTMDQLLDGTSENIIVRGSPMEAVMPEQTTPIVTEIAGVLEQIKDKPQLRTGVAPTLTLDPSVLEKSTMGAFVGALEQASQRLELLVRLFAETAFVPAFQKIHYLLRTYFDEAQDVEIAGQWVKADPSKWQRRSNMKVNVGLGYNNKQIMLGLLSQVLQMQMTALGQNMADFAHIYATLEMFIEQANLGDAATFFIDPRQPGWKPKEPQPDAQMILAQAQANALNREADRKDAESKAKVELDRQKQEFDHANAMETSNATAAKLMQGLSDLKIRYDEQARKWAETEATITHLNRDKNAQEGPAEDSSADEIATADARESKNQAKDGQQQDQAA